MGKCFGFSCFCCGSKGRASSSDPQTSSTLTPTSHETGPSHQMVSSRAAQQEASSQQTPPQQEASSQQTPPPSLEEVKDQLKDGNDKSNVDELIKIIRDLLQWRSAGKSVEDKAESSQSVASIFIGCGETIFKFVNDHAEKSSNKEDTMNSAPQIIEDVLDKLSNVHWLVTGLSVIGYMLHTADEMSENHKRCLDMLQKLVDLFDHVKRLVLQDQEEKVKGDIVMIINGCILCAFNMSSHKLSRYLEALISVQNLRSFERDIDLILTIVNRRTVESVGLEERQKK